MILKVFIGERRSIGVRSLGEVLALVRGVSSPMFSGGIGNRASE